MKLERFKRSMSITTDGWLYGLRHPGTGPEVLNALDLQTHVELGHSTGPPGRPGAMRLELRSPSSVGPDRPAIARGAR
jgi:hypothetical protein